MTFGDLRDFQELMLRAYVRNMMFFATLPYHLATETHGDCMPASANSLGVGRSATYPTHRRVTTSIR
jgi:hypothetical protein